MHEVFVVGLDEFNLAELLTTSRAADCRFHPLLGVEEVRGLDEFRFDELVARASTRLERSGLRPDAICSYWDFPVSEMVPVLASSHGLPSATLESIVRVHHKYWSRLIQSAAVPDVTPSFGVVDPFAVRCADDVPLEFPFWVKPVRSFRSHLAFLVRDEAELDRALGRIREEIPRLADPYSEILDRVTLPADVEGIDGSFCVVEQPVGGLQCTLEGYVHEGRPEIYGVVDSVRAENRISFRRYEYPSRLPARVQQRMTRSSEEVMRALDYQNAPFNVEFFWDRRTDRIWLLEVNARQSQSHAELFAKVDGVPNHQVMVDLALGDAPALVGRGPRRGVAAQWFLRAWRDGVVTRTPRPEELAALQARFPGTTIVIEVAEGDRLADLPDQGSYSYELGVVHAAASSHRELIESHRALLAELPLEVSPLR